MSVCHIIRVTGTESISTYIDTNGQACICIYVHMCARTYIDTHICITVSIKESVIIVTINHLKNSINFFYPLYNRGARGVMVIVAGTGHGDTSSNPGLIAFHIPLGKV